MDLQQDVDLLRNIPLFRNIDSRKLKLIAFTSQRLQFKANENLFVQGDYGDSAFIIIEGEASVLIYTNSDTQIEIAKVKKNDLVGEIAILCDVPRTATVRAKTELLTLEITKEIFFQLVTQFPEMALEVMRELAFRLEKTNRRLQELTIKT
ncbi:MAG: cyclic nucleotide-binding protein [Rhodospirillaceae bacterium]|nr:cyclic nucleotide-binding protein [Alphaproteobacteria bacterium]MBR71918.1 cyclic nucleotide-binding protein [Rhodospirillaceae bacterium]|tara:strand:- start:155 stop:607 length:453 start_codon:yes stop_codon:yes gene_type:complete